MFKSFRLQLTAWYLLFFTLLLCGFSAFLYARLRQHLYQRLDASLAGTVSTTAALFQSELEEAGGNSQIAGPETLRELRLETALVAIYEGERRLAASDRIRNLSGLPRISGTSTFPGFGTRGARITAVTVRPDSRSFTVIGLEPLDSLAAQLDALRHVFFLGLPLAVLIAGLGGFFLASKSIAPVVAMSEQAESITASNLDRRLEVGRTKQEFDRLARVFNELLSRLERSFTSMRDFMADASHELRTPLAVIRGEADVALSQERQPAEYREALAIIQDEAQRLSRLVDDLLNLARADAGHRPLDLEELYLNDLLEDCCRAAQAQARQKGVQLRFASSGDVTLRGDARLLRRLIANLLDNGIRYTPAGGRVSASLDAQEGHARIVISDTGIGIPPELASRVFDRFYRVDKSRSRAEGGFGLGLSIVKWIAEAHDGAVEVTSRPNEGSTFTILLPLQIQPPVPSPQPPFIVHSSQFP